MTDSVRVLIVDDQALIRVGLRGVLESEPGIVVAGEAADGAAAVRAVRAGGIDVVLMDLRMPGVDGIEATRRITAEGGPAVLVLTTFETDGNVLDAVAAGARGYLGKDADPEAVIEAVRVVARGHSLLSPKAMAALTARVPARSPGALTTLTDREREIALLVATGLSNEEIAARLSISPHTVKTHVNRAMAKLGTGDRAALIVAVYDSGIPRPR
ncbi:response regulator [Actinoplanes couchii]|uniref:DNA-binding response regulator n=1 Tax=Actinoplanes couchii TaxID=403638 RepID=A0ABQ3XSH5_9ACTN|nr:response regulator transcription factor [Actinoplanes couchii]MDR6320063.1 DNA-binding NarL/FixJ family response regulator [Actinoplanes couchii]GID61466.1 DNA-binding response regulator [Actinoplanes couchii]